MDSNHVPSKFIWPSRSNGYLGWPDKGQNVVISLWKMQVHKIQKHQTHRWLDFFAKLSTSYIDFRCLVILNLSSLRKHRFPHKLVDLLHRFQVLHNSQLHFIEEASIRHINIAIFMLQISIHRKFSTNNDKIDIRYSRSSPHASKWRRRQKWFARS